MTNSEKRLRQNWELLEAEAVRKRKRNDWFHLDAGLVISDQHVLLAIGPDNLRHILVPTSEDSPVEDTMSSGVQFLTRKLKLKGHGQVQFVDIMCMKDHLHELFELLASDIIARLDVNRADISKQCVLLLDEWRELFSRESRNLLGIDSLTGLFGELVCLREFVSHDTSCVDNWSGPGNGIHDFSFPHVDLEVKTSRIRNGRYASIHGVNQLQQPENGQLFLAFFKVEMVRTGGESVPDLVRSIRNTSINKLEFGKLLALEGYTDDDRQHYEKIRFMPVEDCLYLVDEMFPRIVPGSFVAGSLDSRVTNLSYRIDLSGETPQPIKDHSYRDFVPEYVQA